MLLQKRVQKLEKEFPSYFPQDEKNRLLDMVRTNHLEILFNNEEFNKKYTFYYDSLSYNESLTIGMVLKNLDKNWDFIGLSRNKAISIEMILQTKDIINWDWSQVSANKNLTLKVILDHPEIPWDKEKLLENKNIPLEYFGQDVTKLSKCNLYRNLNISTILENKDNIEDWEWRWISSNKKVKMEDIEEHLYLKWDWPAISYNPNLNVDMIEKYKEKLNWYHVCANEAITMDIIEKHQEWPQVWEAISENESLTIEMVLKNLDKDLYWHTISMMPNMTLEIITEYNHLEWNYEGISGNCNLTSDFVLNNLDKEWNLWAMSYNSMHNYKREKKIIRERICKVLNVNRLMREMREENSYFREFPKDIIDLISIYY